MDTITNTKIAGNPLKTTAVNNFKDEGIASTTTSTGLDNKTKKLETDGSNTAGDKTEFEVNKIAEGKYEFCKNWVENSDFDSKSSSGLSSISASTIYSSSAVDTESELSDAFSGVRINNEFNQTNNNRPTNISSMVQSSTPSMQSLANNQIDIIQQVFKGENSVQSFGDIHVENSNRVHIGNITYVTGPIHIVHTNGGSIDTVHQIADGNRSVHRKIETKTTKTTNLNSHNRTTNHVPTFKIDDDYLDEETEETEESNSPNIFIGKDINQAIDGRTLKIIDRRTWLAQPPLSTEPLDCPVPYVIIAHTATEMTSTQAETVYMVRNIQTYHIESRNWHDIAYNFLIGCDGNVYEGRGWKRVGAHSVGYNRRSIGISFVGCFMNELPPDISLEACRLLIKKGIEDGHIAKDYKLIGHCQSRPTESPGRQLFEEIKTWPMWAETP